MESQNVYVCDICGTPEPLLFKCKHCGGKYCGKHRLPEYHGCSNNHTNNFRIIEKTFDRNLYVCNYCGVTEAALFTCNSCYGKYCSKHKSIEDHNCKSRQISSSNINEKTIKRTNKRSVSKLIKTILDSNLYSAILVIALISIAGLGYYEFFYDPYTVELSYSNGHTTYYEVNSTGDRMYIHNNPNATNPSYQKLINFILGDNTDQILYKSNNTYVEYIITTNNNGVITTTTTPKQHINPDLPPFVCIDYAVQVHDNAEKAGITSGVVTLEFSDESGHALNVFNTTDHGIVYIDCTGQITNTHNNDKVATFKNGSQYTVQPIVNIGNYYYAQDSSIVTAMRTYY